MTAPSLRVARIGVTGTFILAGAVNGVWSVRIPALTEKLHLSPAELGVAVLLFALGATVSLQAGRVLLPRLGSRRALFACGPGSAVLVAGVGLAPSYPLLLVALTAFGVAFGGLDVSMNAQAAAIERELQRHVMNGAHAGWSVGSVLGGATGALTAYLQIGFTAAVVGSAAAALPLALVLLPTYLPEPAATAQRGEPIRFPRVVYLIGVVTGASFMIEGAVNNWSGLYLYRTLHSAEALAALAYPSFELAMIIGRTLGDRVRTAVGARAMLIAAGLGILGGVGLALAVSSWPVALAGFFVTGLSVSTVVPLTFSLAGALDPHGGGLSQVAAMGYGGMLLGPPVIGAVASAAGLRSGLCLVLLLALTISLLTATAPRSVIK